MREVGGKTVGILDPAHKRRADMTIESEELRRALMVRIHDRLIPMIERAFQFRATRMERSSSRAMTALRAGIFARIGITPPRAPPIADLACRSTSMPENTKAGNCVSRSSDLASTARRQAGRSYSPARCCMKRARLGAGGAMPFCRFSTTMRRPASGKRTIPASTIMSVHTGGNFALHRRRSIGWVRQRTHWPGAVRPE